MGERILHHIFTKWIPLWKWSRRGDNGIPVSDYVEENVFTKVVKLIQSYTGVVNRMAWRKF